MKKLLFIFSIIFISCSPDGDTPNFEGSQSDLTGTWNLSSIKYEGVDITNDCYKKSTINVSSDGSAIWTEYSGTPCNSSSRNYMFKALNVNFTINEDFEYTNYYGKFFSKNDIEITVLFNDNNGLESKTIYRFKK